MSSPLQRRGSCGHMMAGFDTHKKCARCRDKGIGDDPCVLKEVCGICASFTDTQRSMLSTPQYQIRREKKAGLLVSPSKVTIVGPVKDIPQDYAEQEAAHMSSVTNEPEMYTISHHSPSEFVSRQDLNMLSNQLEEKFASFEALLSRTNIFSTPKLPVSGTNSVVSDKPFINPSDPRATSLVRSPGPDRDQSAERLDKKGKSTGKSKNKKKSSIVSAAAGKPGDLPPDMPPTGYSLSATTDAPVVPASEPDSTGPTSQPASFSSVPTSSSTSAPATGSGSDRQSTVCIPGSGLCCFR